VHCVAYIHLQYYLLRTGPGKQADSMLDYRIKPVLLIWLLVPIGHVVAFPQDLTFRPALYTDIQNTETCEIVTAYLNHTEIFPNEIAAIIVKLYSFKFYKCKYGSQ
jgi:hypothetical protein